MVVSWEGKDSGVMGWEHTKLLLMRFKGLDWKKFPQDALPSVLLFL